MMKKFLFAILMLGKLAAAEVVSQEDVAYLAELARWRRHSGCRGNQNNQVRLPEQAVLWNCASVCGQCGAMIFGFPGADRSSV